MLRQAGVDVDRRRFEAIPTRWAGWLPGGGWQPGNWQIEPDLSNSPSR